MVCLFLGVIFPVNFDLIGIGVFALCCAVGRGGPRGAHGVVVAASVGEEALKVECALCCGGCCCRCCRCASGCMKTQSVPFKKLPCW